MQKTDHTDGSSNDDNASCLNPSFFIQLSVAEQKKCPTIYSILCRLSSEICPLFSLYHRVSESRNNCFKSSALAGRGDSLVTRC